MKPIRLMQWLAVLALLCMGSSASLFGQIESQEAIKQPVHKAGDITARISTISERVEIDNPSPKTIEQPALKTDDITASILASSESVEIDNPLIINISFLNNGQVPVTIKYTYPQAFMVTLLSPEGTSEKVSWMPDESPARAIEATIPAGGNYNEIVILGWSYKGEEVQATFPKQGIFHVSVVVKLDDHGILACPSVTVNVVDRKGEIPRLPPSEFLNNTMLLLLPAGKDIRNTTKIQRSSNALEVIREWAARDKELGYLARNALYRACFLDLLAECTQKQLWGEPVKKLDTFRIISELPGVAREREYCPSLARERKAMAAYVRILLQDFNMAKSDMEKLVQENANDAMSEFASSCLSKWSQLYERAARWDEMKRKMEEMKRKMEEAKDNMQ